MEAPLSAMPTVAEQNILLSKERVNNWIAYYPKFTQEIKFLSNDPVVSEVKQHFLKFIDYLLPYGKKLRGSITIASCEMLEKDKKLVASSEENINLLGWIVELSQGLLRVSDDIVDNTATRRGRICWHRLENVGLNAINDFLLLEQTVNLLLKNRFSKEQYYVPVLEQILESTGVVWLGQEAENLYKENGRPNFKKFTMDRHKRIAELKTGHQTFYMPVAIGMYMADMYDKNLHAQVLYIANMLGHYYQIENDYNDYVGTIKGININGGNDIQQGQCTWFGVLALQRGNAAQKKLFEQHYGSLSDESRDIILDLYSQLDLPNLYSAVRRDYKNSISHEIQKLVDHKDLRSLLESLLKSVEDSNK